MARARNIKPSFFKDAKIVGCSFPARILFQGLWCLADYMGRIKYEPIEVKMEIFPADDVSVESLMSELEGKNLIEIYTDHSGATLVQVLNFTKHQNPHVNERVGKDKKPLPCLPSLDECKSASSVSEDKKPSLKQSVMDALVVLREYSESDPADSLNLIPDSLFPLTDSLNADSLNTDSCSSDDSQSASPQSKTPKQKLTKTDLINEFEIDPDVAEAWLVIRNAKKSPLTRVAIDSLINEFSKAGLSTPNGIRLCVEKGWVGFKASWDWQDKPKQSASTGFNERVYTSHTPAWAEEACDE
jgi:hypothetical protein